MLNVTGAYAYTTSEGDTFDALALDVYDDEKKAHYIIQNNPDYADMIIFPAGITLYIPIIEDMETEEDVPPWRK